MTTPSDNEFFEAYVPVYDVVPDKWEDAQPFIVEQLRKITTSLNAKEIGWFLDEEVLTGKAFIPGTVIVGAGDVGQNYRSVFRKVIPFGALVIGVNSKPHGLVIDANFTLIDLWGAATNTGTLTGEPIPNGADTMSYDATNININVAAAYTRAYAVIEYLTEL